MPRAQAAIGIVTVGFGRSWEARVRHAPARWDRKEREGSLVVVQGATALISKNWRHPTGGRLGDGVRGERSLLLVTGCRESWNASPDR